MKFDIVTWLVLGFASYRLTRFLIIDSLIDGFRNKFHGFVVNRSQKNGRLHLLWEKLYELSSCTFCAGFWISLLAYSLWAWNNPTDFNQLDWINVFAVSGVQALLHAFEPDTE